MTSRHARPSCPEVPQFENQRDRERSEELAEFYAIIRTTEALESAFNRQSMSAAVYEEICYAYIRQFKTTERALQQCAAITTAENFFKEFQLDCPFAHQRLIIDGTPSTNMSRNVSVTTDRQAYVQATQAFITAMDAIKLDQREMDEIQPHIRDILVGLNKIQGLPADFEGLTKMKSWLQRLNEMRATDAIDEQNARQLAFDLESSYGAFVAFTESSK